MPSLFDNLSTHQQMRFQCTHTPLSIESGPLSLPAHTDVVFQRSVSYLTFAAESHQCLGTGAKIYVGIL